MAKKSNKKILYISLSLLIMVIAGIFLYIYIQKTSNPALSDCIKDWRNRHSEPKEFASGVITVHFTSGVTEQEAKQLIQKYELPVLKTYFDNSSDAYSFDIKVPVGTEVKWLCKIQVENPALVGLAIAVPKFLLTS